MSVPVGVEWEKISNNPSWPTFKCRSDNCKSPVNGAIAWRVLAMVLAWALTLLSVHFERTGPALVQYGNLCGPESSDPCYEPELEAGFPLAYLSDVPGVSVEHQLALVEDNLDPWALAVDVGFYFVAILFVADARTRMAGRFRRAPNSSVTYRSQRPSMKPYRNSHGDSGVVAFEMDACSIKVEFKHGGCYLYDSSAPGENHVVEMCRLAKAGEGLNTYINQHVRQNYAQRLW